MRRFIFIPMFGLWLLTGCNYYGLTSATGSSGQIVNIHGQLQLDANTRVRGIQAQVVVSPPLLLFGCYPPATQFSMSTSLDPHQARVIAVPDNDAEWSGDNDVFTCQVYIPPATPAGHYPVTLTNPGLSDKMGREVSFTIFNGGVDVG